MKTRTITFILMLLLFLAACGGSEAPATETPAEEAPAAEAPAAETEAESGDQCAVENLALFEAGKLTVATGEPVFPPWMLDDDPSNGQGFESAFIYALAEEMGFAAADVQWVRTSFDEAISPAEKPYDFNIQQYSITPEREEVVDFSDPYYLVQQAVVALEGSPAATATTFAELREATFGAMVGTTDLETIENDIGAEDVAVYNSVADVVAAMSAGQIDATVIGLPTAYFMTAVQLDNGVIAGILPGESEDGFGMLFADGSELTPCVNQALQQLNDNGTIDALIDEWLAAGGDIPTITEEGDSGAADTTESATADVCAVENLALFEAGKLTVATGEPVFPPWMLDDDPSNGQGFESAFIYALAEEMGFAAADVQWVRTSFDEAISPAEKPYDFNIQQYSITPEREEVVDFSDPYYLVQQAVVALEGSPAATATSFAELREAKFGAMVGTTDLETIENDIGAEDVAVYNSVADVVAAMSAGQIDATVIGLPTAYFMTAVQLDNGVIAGILPGESEDGFGMLFTDGSELTPCVNQALQQLNESGAIDALVAEWLQGDGDIPTISE